ncbi:DUF6630 family protein [Amnibacterium endophyticum]|uniref:DUF6630 domain-containing protein n=1 Tax=Amnibacterium endophyticum TaxID=2109337 RepID=A0ABW4LBD8_9MICO
MAGAGDWERLARLIEDDDAVAAAVRDAVEGGEDPWEALLDGLDEAGALAYLHADDTGMELTDALAQLPRVFAAQPDLDEATDTDDLPAATRIADGVLAADGLRVVRLVEDDQSWPLVVLPEERVKDVLRATAACGQEASLGG